jgi:hypothetical protein
MSAPEIPRRKNSAIFFRVTPEVYKAIDNYRHSKGATQKQIILQAIALAMLQDQWNKSDVNKVVDHFHGSE